MLWFVLQICRFLHYLFDTGFHFAFEEAEMVRLLYMWVGYAQGWRCKSLHASLCGPNKSIWTHMQLLKTKERQQIKPAKRQNIHNFHLFGLNDLI